MKERLVVFDVNETLLSLDPIRDRLAEIFGPNPPTGEWFARLLHGSLLANEFDQHRPFGEIGVDALVGVAARRSMDLSADEARDVVSLMKSLPPHPDVVPGVQRMFDAGIRMIALTNSSEDAATAQMANAGVIDMLEDVLSVDRFGKFKPHSVPYRGAAAELDVGIESLLMVAAHDWDCAGALAAGGQSVFVLRPGVSWGLPSPEPEMKVSGILELAEKLGA